MNGIRLLSVAILSLAASPYFAAAEGADEATTKILLDAISKAETSDAAAEAYEQAFVHLGRAGLRDLLSHENPSIALQAAWELQRKIVKVATPGQATID